MYKASCLVLWVKPGELFTISALQLFTLVRETDQLKSSNIYQKKKKNVLWGYHI